MKRASILVGVCLISLFVGFSTVRSGSVQDQPGSAASGRAKDETALRALLAGFTKAFNAGDAKGVAALFTTNAKVTTLDGRVINGQPAIEKQFAASFETTPGQTIEIKTESLRFLDAESAIEDGTSTVTTPATAGETEGTTEATRYSVAYVKRDGQWLQDSIRDYALPEPTQELTAKDWLKELEWLVGDWVDESDEAEVRTTCRWAESKSFLLRSFQVKIRGKAAMSGSQRIGWDPKLKQFRSWVFDSDGGFSEGVFSRDGERWVLKTVGTLKDGKTATATNILTRISNDTLKWASVDRTLGAEVLPDSEEITLVRTPPQPRPARSTSNPTPVERKQP